MANRPNIKRRQWPSLLLSACVALIPIGCGSSPPVMESKYDKIESGMTEREVTAILGTPLRIKEKDEGIEEMTWKFEPDSNKPDIRGSIAVVLDHGKVQDKKFSVVGSKNSKWEHSKPLLLLDRLAREDFVRRLTVIHVSILGGAGLFIVGADPPLSLPPIQFHTNRITFSTPLRGHYRDLQALSCHDAKQPREWHVGNITSNA